MGKVKYNILKSLGLDFGDSLRGWEKENSDRKTFEK